MLQQGSEQFFSPKKSLIHIIRGMKQGILPFEILAIKFLSRSKIVELVELEMPCSQLEQLWSEGQVCFSTLLYQI
jgi:hypothetical protein